LNQDQNFVYFRVFKKSFKSFSLNPETFRKMNKLLKSEIGTVVFFASSQQI